MKDGPPGTYLKAFIADCERNFAGDARFLWNGSTSVRFRRYVAERHEIESTIKGDLVINTRKVNISDTLWSFLEEDAEEEKRQWISLLILLLKERMEKAERNGNI